MNDYYCNYLKNNINEFKEKIDSLDIEKNELNEMMKINRSFKLPIFFASALPCALILLSSNEFTMGCFALLSISIYVGLSKKNNMEYDEAYEKRDEVDEEVRRLEKLMEENQKKLVKEMNESKEKIDIPFMSRSSIIEETLKQNNELTLKKRNYF